MDAVCWEQRVCCEVTGDDIRNEGWDYFERYSSSMYV